MDDIQVKIDKLENVIRRYGKPAIAFSGGSDSSFLVSFARVHMNKDVVALIADSPFLPRTDLEDAAAFCESFNIDHQIVPFDPLSVPQIVENEHERCYCCKDRLFNLLIQAADAGECDAVMDGSVTDDLDDWRPGMRAVRELGVVSPLLEADISKADIAAIVEKLSMTVISKPPSACLATRIPEGQPIRPDHLKMAETAERILRDVGVEEVRVRVHDSHGSTVARIEVPLDRMGFFADDENRETTIKVLHAVGFNYITLDLGGYRPAGMSA